LSIPKHRYIIILKNKIRNDPANIERKDAGIKAFLNLKAKSPKTINKY